jgi:hypothetical protein
VDLPQTGIRKVFHSPDGKSFLTVDAGQTIRLFELATGQERQRFQGPEWIMGCALTPDGSSLAAWSGDRKVRVWDVKTGRKRHEYSLPLNKESIPPGENRVLSLYNAALSRDGRLLAVGSQHNHGWATDDQGRIVEGAKPEHYLMFLDLSTGCIIGRIDRATSDASSLAFSPDGRELAWAGYNDPAIHLIEVAGGRERRRLLGHRGSVYTLTFSADGKLLLSGSSDTTALVWDLARRFDPRPAPTAAEMELFWKDLADEDAARAYAAIRKLAASPHATVPFLRQRLRPVPPVDDKRIARLIADLDSDDFATRQNSAAELKKLADQALPAYRKALAGKPSIETRRRLEDMLEKAGPGWWDVSGERLRSLRAIEALELAGTTEAREVLATLAGGDGGARLTEQAKAAQDRLASRGEN